MAPMLVVVLLMLVSSVTIASSLQCYSCVREGDPDADKYCNITSSSSLGNNAIINCTSSDCIITKTVKASNSVTQFRRGCKQEYDTCTDKCTDPNSNGTVVCNSCCQENLCNNGTGPAPQKPTTANTTTAPTTAATIPTTPIAATSRITMVKGLYALGGFLMWFFL